MASFGTVDSDSKGFTLIEVLIAIVLLGVGLLGMASLAGSLINYNRFAHSVTIGTTLAQDKIEELRNTRYDGIVEGTVVESSIDATGNAGGTYNRKTEIDADAAFSNTKTVEVTVSWAWKGTTHNVVLKTIVAR